nr:MAG TPA: hypothetical protein [Caudoviricetes sp.]
MNKYHRFFNAILNGWQVIFSTKYLDFSCILLYYLYKISIKRSDT